jgi:hypothetical protein
MATKNCKKCGGTITKKMKEGGMATKVLGPAKKPFAAGIPYFTGAGQTGPESMKKGGATKTKKALPKAQDGLDLNWANARPDKKIGALEPTGAKIGVGGVLLGAAGMGVKALVDKVKKIKAKKKAEEEKKKKETPKAKFGSSVPVQHSPSPGRVRSSSGVGTVPVGARKKKGGAVKKK